MRQVIKHRDIRLLNMIRRTDPVILRVSQDYFHCCLLDFHAHVPVET